MAGPSPWTKDERRILTTLRTPRQIQAYLDALPYRTESVYRSPRSVLRDGCAHCFDGALFAAAALCRLGYLPRLVDLRAHNDDDHVIAIYRKDGCYGAVAKSNTTGLRLREPIHRSLRELVMTYFDDYFNLDGQRTLRSYSYPLDLRHFDRIRWMTCDDGLAAIAEHLDDLHHYPLLTKRQITRLTPMDERARRAGFLGADEAGLYKP